MQLVLFSKHLQALSIEDAGKVIRNLGLDGVDLTVRPGGHVEPGCVARALPEAVRVLAELGLSVPMITTAITGASEPEAEAVVAAAAACGIRELKLGYWRYDGFGSLRAQLDRAASELDGLEALAGRYDVRLSLHTHSGRYLSASAGNLFLLVCSRDPRRVGVYADPGHMTLEGGAAGWMQGLDLLQEHLSLVAVKSFGWFPERNSAGEEVTWHHRLVPLRQGTVRWREVFACLRELHWSGILSLHSEYQGPHSWRDLSTMELIEQTRDDLEFLRPVLRECGYRTGGSEDSAPGR